MALDRDKLRREIQALYKREHEELGEKGTLERLEQAEQWDFSSVLTDGGILVFPHVDVQDCGHQVAAAVQACLNSGADRVIFISVLHALTQELEDARVRVAQGGEPAAEASWGIHGPGLTTTVDWAQDHAPMSFRHFWAAETKRRGVKGPEVIERFPYLAGGKPEALPGMANLVKLAGTPPEEALYPEEGGLELARETIEEGMVILGRGDYWGYNQHCVDAKSDHRDAGQVMRFLRGPMSGRIVDMTYSIAEELYNAPPPTWVAAPLVVWELED
ncbi:MAG: hypothetical protein P8046_13110 [Anaerolineales bacterium]